MLKKSNPMYMKLRRLTNLYDISAKQIGTYVRNLHRHMRKQNVRIRKLRRKLASLRNRHKAELASHKLEQEDDEPTVKTEKDDEHEDFLKALEKAELQHVQEAKAAEPLDVKAFVDDIKKTAQSVDYQSRYIFEPTSGLYYDPETGYYYNATYDLHYDGTRGCYLKYNEETRDYDFYSQVISQETIEAQQPKKTEKTKRRRQRPRSRDDSERERGRDRDRRGRDKAYSDEDEYERRRSRDRYRRRRSRSLSEPRKGRRKHRRSRSRSHYTLSSRSKSKTDSEEEIRELRRLRDERKERKEEQRAKRLNKVEDSEEEEGELASSSDSDSTNSDERRSVISIGSTSSGTHELVVDYKAGNSSALAKQYPPSLRLIVQETALPALKKGSLFIVTCKGGSLGREGDHDVIIPDLNVSKFHLKFLYKHCHYQVLDLGSRNGTLLNGNRMSPSKQESETFQLEHRDVLQLGQTKLLCHVHEGSFTCSQCEPGLLIERDGCDAGAAGDAHIKPVSYKEGLKRLQKRYGLEEEKYVDPPVNLPVDYKDRAASRRKLVGSSTEHAKVEVASVDQAIGHQNKGFKMLAKMGWSEGKGLGKNDGGRTEPVPLVSNVGTGGLGAQALVDPTVYSLEPSNKQKMRKAIALKTQQRYAACEDVEETPVAKPTEKHVATLDKQISSENKGFQMLAKMGWNQGESLGPGEDGLKEPVKIMSNVGTSGLGSKPLVTGQAVASKSKTIWKKQQPKCKPVKKVFEESDSE
ncbi:angiogenic factor with G patch and FHA domains 1 isoform X1 [Uranotaenia lowii]|uniref:angiogenic factor with G patch and FHA domains 1 isoform X1 n=1 Tax=Uranotaenia lowii TaxID=190385 RepID=UPI002478F694|nr:angiogenic factor with G patch and FHA domains 1 isoform X1 [Uranotaenia lowii]